MIVIKNLSPIFATMLHLNFILNKKIMKKLILLSLLPFVLFACKDDEETVEAQDAEKPTFQSITVNGKASVNNKEIEIEIEEDEATTLSVKVSVADNKELSELQVNIHEAFDGHDHDHRIVSEGTDTLSFGPKIYTLGGTSAEETIEVPVSAEVIHGEYHVECIVLDKSGNRAEINVPFHLEGHDHDHEH